MKLNLPFDFLKKKVDEKEEYLGIFLKENEGVVFFLESSGHSLHKVAQEKFNYTNGWENLTEDLDEVLYRMELSAKKSPEKTIFFVYSHLVDQETGQIKKEYLHKIKEATKSLELQPMGYIECHEAIVKHLHNKEGIALTALVLEFDKSALEIFLYKSGKLEHEETIERTDDLIADLTPALEKTRQKSILPTRLILYDSKNLDQEISKILGHKWDSSHFVQLPKIEIVHENDLFTGLIETFAAQLFTAPSLAKEEPKEVMGFTIGGEPQPAPPQTQGETETFEEPLPTQVEQKRKFQLSMPAIFATVLTKIDPIRRKLKELWSNLKLPQLPNNSFLPIIGAAVIILILILTELLFHKAKLTVYLPYQSINSELDLNLESDKVAKKTESTEVKSSKTTTGKRDVGEKAKGVVTVHNFDNKEVIFREGTVLTTSSLKFLLDDDVKVASASLASDGSAKLPGKGQAKVTAEEIGTEGNVGKNQRFVIENLSDADYFAINDQAFAGGSKKQIKTVAKADTDALLEKVESDAAKFLETQIVPKVGKKYELLKQLNQIKLSGSTFSHEVGEEADTLDLKSKANINYYLLEKDVLLKEFMSNLNDEVKSGYKIKPENITYKISDATIEDGAFAISAAVKAKAAQELKEEELAKSLKGKSTKKAEELIQEQFKSKVDFEISNPLPFLKSRIPFRKGSIDIEISYL